MKNRELILIVCLIPMICSSLISQSFAEEIVSVETISQQKIDLVAFAADEQTVIAFADVDTVPKAEECPIVINDQAKVQNDDKEDEVNRNELADPLYFVNYGVYVVNDKLYYWLLKPVTAGFKLVTPEIVRVGVSNVFSNLREPVNFTNSLFQFKFGDFAQGIGRFIFNSTIGVAGIFDVSCDLLDWCKKDADFGQTLGYYGIDQGIYIVWPIFGPSSLRDTVGLAGDVMLSPPTYIGYFYLDFLQSSGAMSFERINNLSFGTNYELLNSAVDPYTALKTAFEDCRAAKIKQAQER
jgi:phospholipid-binding lipoprotein MlaA